MYYKSFCWQVGDVLISKTNQFNLTKGKEYTIFNDTMYDDIFVIENDLGILEDFVDTWFEIKNKYYKEGSGFD